MKTIIGQTILFIGILMLLSALMMYLTGTARAANNPASPVQIEQPVQELGQLRTSPKCGTYVFMSRDLLMQGFVHIGDGQVNQEGDRWSFFINPNDQRLWVVLVVVMYQEYNGLTPGSACEIMVGIDWKPEEEG